MTARADALRLIEEAGGTFEEWGDSRELRGSADLDSAVWKATGTHSLAVEFYSDRPAGWRALLEDVQKGTEPCTDDLCDWCET